MLTGSPFFPLTHFIWHCPSCGHTRPQTAASAFFDLMIAMPSAYLPFSDAVDELRDRHVHRAAFPALGVLALQASGRLFQCHLLGVSKGDLAEVLDTLVRLLPRHRHVLIRRSTCGVLSFFSGSGPVTLAAPFRFPKDLELNLSSGSIVRWRLMSSSKLVWCPSNSGPSTHPNIILSAHGHTADTAHAHAVDHDRCQGHDGRDAVGAW